MNYLRQRFIDELNDEGDIEIRGVVFTRHQVLQDMDEIAHDEIFNDWVLQTKQDTRERSEVFLREHGCLTRFNTLARRTRDSLVMPWVGAGMSYSSGFPLWGNFLRGACADGPELYEETERLLSAGLFEDAAQHVSDNMTQNILDEEIENTFGDRHPNVSGPVQLLPHIFSEGCVTTNFDYVIDEVYLQSNCGTFGQRLIGNELIEAPRRYAEERHCLFRIHGEANQRAGRVLTRDEYNQTYRNEVILQDVLNGLIGQKSMLFLGCSLTVDRTMSALTDLKMRAGVQNARHYAFLPLPPEEERRVRRLQLESADIHPIWYPNDGEHDQHIEDLFIALMGGPLT